MLLGDQKALILDYSMPLVVRYSFVAVLDGEAVFRATSVCQGHDRCRILPLLSEARREAFLNKAAGEALRGDVGKQEEGSRPAIDSAPAGLRLDPKAVRQALESLRHFPEEPPESSSSQGKDLGPDEQRSAYR